MKLTISWLKDHLETSATVSEIAEALTDLGLEVEGVEDPASRLKGFRLGYVESAEKHPDADRLRVCQVRTQDGVKQIICGAPNARAGITAVIAEPGMYVPGIDTTIGVGKIRGVESHGMMASERELELSDEHDGIIELPSGEVGEEFADWLERNRPGTLDPVIEIGITPNRPDALGIRGIARDLAARGLGTLKPRAPAEVAASFEAPMTVTIDEDTLDGCPVFCGRVIRGVTNGPSPDWLQRRLKAIGLRPINFLVDVTNFFTHDSNRPLHVFDLAKVEGDLRVHRAEGGEEILALDGKTYALGAGDMVISDGRGPESIAGIMGGEETGCTEETRDVFVESAYWDPVTIAMTGRGLKVHSDARYRFERGVDPTFTPEGLDLAVAMILEQAGGEASGMIVAGEVPDTSRAYRFDPSAMERVVGMSVPEDEQRRILHALGFALDGDMASVPSWRPDVRGEIDLVEEVARVASLTKLEGAPMARQRAGVPEPVLTPMQIRERTARRMAAGLGYDEVVTYSFIEETAAALFGGGGEATRLENPISSEMSHMRPSLLPGLLRSAARMQARGASALSLFECGPTFSGGEPEEQALEISGLLVGAEPLTPASPARPRDLYDLKADLEALLAALGAPERAQVMREAPGWYHPGRSGRIGLGPKKIVASFGEVHPRVLEAMDVRGPAMAFTVHLAELPFPRSTSASRGAADLPELQAVERDLAFVVDARTEAQALLNAARGADKALIDGVRVFDSFEGGSLGEGVKSLAITVRLQPREKTLTDAEIEAVMGKVTEKVAKATGGVLRG